RELPVVPRIEGRGVQDEDRDLGASMPVLVLRSEVGVVALRPHREFAHHAAGSSKAVCVLHVRVQKLLEQLAVSPGAGEPRLEERPKGRDRVCGDACADVLLHACEEVVSDPANELDVVALADLAVRLLLEQLLQLQVQVGADDGAAGDARENLDMTKRVALGERSYDADVEEGGAKA